MKNGKTPEKDNNLDISNNNYKRPGSYSDNYKRKYDEYFAKEIKKEVRLPKKLNEFKKPEASPSQRSFQQRLILEDVEKFVVSRKARRIEKIIIAIIYIAVILVAIYFILATFFPEYLPGSNTYEIKASDSKLFNTLDSFYIEDQSVLGEKKTINTMTVRPIISSKKFDFAFAPKENIPAEKKASFFLDLVINKDIPGNIYVDDNLIFPNLENYQLLAETDSDYVYVNKEMAQYVGNVTAGNSEDVVKLNGESETVPYISERTEDFLYKNLASASVWATRKLGSVDMSVSDYKISWTKINGTFRGELKLAVYTEDNLDIDFIKQDLNGYIGQDEYTINVKNSLGDVVYTEIFGDDGDKTKSGKLGKEQKSTIFVKNLEKGVYYITFQKDNYNDAVDSTIKNIEINSNKVLILGTFLPITPFEFYTKADGNKKIGFYYWWTGKDQVLNITGTRNFNINLDKEWFSKTYDKNLTKGEYSINLEKGYLWIYNDVSAPSKENWFEIPAIQQEKFDNPSIIVIDKYKFDKNLGLFSFSKDVDISKKPVKISLRALERNSASFKDAWISIK